MASTRLPSYTVERPRGSGRFFWQLPSWARPPAVRNGFKCPVTSRALGTDKGDAITKAEQLNEALAEWRKGNDAGPQKGTVAWLFAWYRRQERFTSKSAKTRRDYGKLMDILAAEPMKSGRPFADAPAARVDAAAADKLYKRLRERGDRQAAYAMQVCRLVWSWATRHHKTTGVKENPFMGMGLKSVASKGNRATSRAEYDLYRAAARKLGFQSMATAAALCFECCQRTGDAFRYEDPEDVDKAGGFIWAGYHPGDRIELVQRKTGNSVLLPLTMAIESEEPWTMLLYPELMVELARAKAVRSTDTSTGTSTETSPGIIVEERNGKPYTERRMSSVHRKICVEAGLPKDMTFTGFRHGGITEVGTVDADVRPISGHTVLDTTRIYNKATVEKARAIGVARRAMVAG